MEIYQPIFIFFVTAAVSFVGSLQLGPVNVSVVQATLQQNRQAGFWVAVGGVLPEMVYAVLAVWAGSWLVIYPTVWQTLEWLAVPALLILGFFTYCTPERAPLVSVATSRGSKPLLRGFALGLLNPQLFPYWLVVLVQFKSYKLLNISTFSQKMAFVLGTAGGAFGLLLGFIYLAYRRKAWLMQQLGQVPLNKYLGAFFGLLALIQALKLTLI
ncbi:MAG: hypothetical protein EAZ14_08575 [Runella slithyformis]|nr:MAG: hypothetical protein EAZ46_10820 [Runella sp.]TAG17088.1 MAG: hypothetical protein EAZ38_17920 [Cytophagales bacterium]TAG36229.1 MAG: hypothetical protein EAZ32_17315 [Cytophagia bacterium]TAG52649.1 MAG: hypothetical protein EAZ29_07085 [Runella slithyformis]TAG69508.1 MAG: hypothetical protein EAZ26_06935 [Runella slithyformis]